MSWSQWKSSHFDIVQLVKHSFSKKLSTTRQVTQEHNLSASERFIMITFASLWDTWKKTYKPNKGPAKLKQINSTPYRRGFDFSVLAGVVLSVIMAVRSGSEMLAVAGMRCADDAAGCRHVDDARWGEPEEQDPRMARFLSRIKAERWILSRCAVLFHGNYS